MFINILLDNGYDDNGNQVYAYLTLPEINPETFDKNKALAIVSDIEPCLSKTISVVHKIEGTQVSILTD